MSPAELPRGAQRLERALQVLLGILLCAWTWRGWADPLVDYGRELYGAWRLAEGERLGIDLYWLQGPLSVEVNALLFRLFGASYQTLFLADLGVLWLTIVLLRALLRRAFGAWTASAASVLVLAIFAFGQYGVVGNYSLAAPYAHELTHGFLFALLALWALERAAESGSRFWPALGGFALGALALTKAEVFCAGAGAVCLRAALTLREARWVGRRAALVVLMLVGAALPVLLTFAAYARTRSNLEAWSTTLGAFAYWMRAELHQLPFYKAGMGLDDPLANVDRMLRGSLAYLALLLGPTLLVARARHVGLQKFAAMLCCALLSLGLAWVFRAHIPWRALGRPFPVHCAFAFVMAVVEHFRAKDPLAARRQAALASFALFAGLLLAKIVLHARILHYGFVLGLPAALIVVGWMFDALPAWVASRGGPRGSLRGAFAGILFCTICVHLQWTAEWVRQDDDELGTGADRMRVATRGRLASEALAQIEASLGSEDSLLVLPEGVTLNYLARRKSPTPYINFMPPEVLLYGEETILEALRAHPPTLVALVHKDTSEYGFPRFGQDYGQAIYAHILAHYTPITLFGSPPLQDQSFGIALLARR